MKNLAYVCRHVRSRKVETKEFMIFVLAVGPMLWIALAIWCIVRQATGPKLNAEFFAVIFVVQMIVLVSPFAIHIWSVNAAGLSDFAGCPNGQEYCDEFYQLERLRDGLFFHLEAAIWAGVMVWILTMLRKADVRAKHSI